jgi:hypothetical protein
VPTLLLTAEDDPFISSEPYRRPEVTSNPALTVVITPRGGHCGFVERPTPGYDGYWAERLVVDFVRQRMGAGTPCRGRTPVAGHED